MNEETVRAAMHNLIEQMQELGYGVLVVVDMSDHTNGVMHFGCAVGANHEMYIPRFFEQVMNTIQLAEQQGRSQWN